MATGNAGNPYLDELENDLEKVDSKQDTIFLQLKTPGQEAHEAMGLGSKIDFFLVNEEITLQFSMYILVSTSVADVRC